MTDLPLPNSVDEMLGFCKEIAHMVNVTENHNVDARIGSTHCKLVVHQSCVQNSDDNSEMEFVVIGEDAKGEKVTWKEKLSRISVRRFGHGGYYLASASQKSLLLYL